MLWYNGGVISKLSWICCNQQVWGLKDMLRRCAHESWWLSQSEMLITYNPANIILGFANSFNKQWYGERNMCCPQQRPRSPGWSLIMADVSWIMGTNDCILTKKIRWCLHNFPDHAKSNKFQCSLALFHFENVSVNCTQICYWIR